MARARVCTHLYMIHVCASLRNEGHFSTDDYVYFKTRDACLRWCALGYISSKISERESEHKKTSSLCRDRRDICSSTSTSVRAREIGSDEIETRATNFYQFPSIPKEKVQSS
jgi:hypothetical protein